MRFGRIVLAAALVDVVLLGVTASAQIFLTNNTANTIGKYNLDGSTINTSLITGLHTPTSIAVSGANLFVLNSATATIGEYTTTGGTVSPSLISGLSGPTALAVSADNLFVANRNGGGFAGTIAQYTAAGALVNASLVSGLDEPGALAISDDGANLFVLNANGTVGKYSTSGAVVNASLISGLTSPAALAVSGGTVFITNVSGNSVGRYDATSGSALGTFPVSFDPRAIAAFSSSLYIDRSNGFVGQYSTLGTAINASLISGVNPPGIAVIPEPGACALAIFGFAVLSAHRHRKRPFCANGETKGPAKGGPAKGTFLIHLVSGELGTSRLLLPGN